MIWAQQDKMELSEGGEEEGGQQGGTGWPGQACGGLCSSEWRVLGAVLEPRTTGQNPSFPRFLSRVWRLGHGSDKCPPWP